MVVDGNATLVGPTAADALGRLLVKPSHKPQLLELCDLRSTLNHVASAAKVSGIFISPARTRRIPVEAHTSCALIALNIPGRAAAASY